jgi:hypothetical protein
MVPVCHLDGQPATPLDPQKIESTFFENCRPVMCIIARATFFF